MATMVIRVASVVAPLVLVFVLAGGPYAGTAHACSCAGTLSVAEELRASDAVFSGEMIRGGVEDPRPGDGTMMGGIEFRVIDSWRGVSDETAVVYGQAAPYYGKLEEGKMYTDNSCTYLFEKGKSYLVYASRYQGGLGAFSCSRTTTLGSAQKDLDALGPPAGRLTDTGGPVLLPAVLLAATAAFSVSAWMLIRRSRA